MKAQVQTWRPPWLGRPLQAGRYGHFGRPVIFFPTGGADWLDCERFQMVAALGPLIEGGAIKLYSVDAVNRDAWTAPGLPPWERARLQALYDDWLLRELIPAIRQDCAGYTGPLITAGASLGAYQAYNALCKHPEHIGAGIGMSGTYVLDRRVEGWEGLDLHDNQPTRFLPLLDEGPQLRRLRQRFFLFGLGSGPHENPAYTWAAANALGARGVPNRVEIWGPGSDHDWPTWRAMLPLFLGYVMRSL